MYASPAILTDSFKKMIDESVRDSKEVAEKFEKLCNEKRMDHRVHVQSANNDSPGQTLCNIANRSMCDVIVMGTRGLDTVRRTFLGSVSDYVIHHAGLPTVVIPPDRH